jgi:hypothetical protein
LGIVSRLKQFKSVRYATFLPWICSCSHSDHAGLPDDPATLVIPETSILKRFQASFSVCGKELTLAGKSPLP